MKDIFAGNQVIHEMSDRYGWKEGSAEKTVLHGALGALTGKMSGGNVLSGAVSESVNEFALGYIEKTKGEEWMDTHPDTVQAISTALGAVAGSLAGDRNTGAYTAQMGTKWNYYEKYPNMKEKMEKYLSSDEYKQQEAGTAHVIYLDDSTEHGVIITKDSNTGAGRIIDINSRSGETFNHLNPSGDGIRPYDKNVTFKRIDKGNDHPTGVSPHKNHEFDAYLIQGGIGSFEGGYIYDFKTDRSYFSHGGALAKSPSLINFEIPGEQDGTVANGHALF